MQRSILIITLLMSCTLSLHAQIGQQDESKLYAETKQLGQFIRRFNAEEDAKGDRLYQGDKEWRDRNLRRKYLSMLFDKERSWDKKTVESFVERMTDKSSPVYLDFHGGDWRAEVQATFSYEGKDVHGRLLMRLKEEPVGSRWVIEQVWMPPFEAAAKKDTSNAGFLHPLSHELAFMNLHKVLRQSKSPYAYIAQDEEIDQLSIFAYEIRRGRLQFKQVDDIRFHFFLDAGWYFELAYQQRDSYNRGWLMVNLLPLATPELRSQLRQQLFSQP